MVFDELCLGSTSYITDVFGKPCQYIEYLPFGEVMVEQSTNNILENVYKFNAKELDSQTGYYYYGARYYDPGAGIFLSVDPLAEKMPDYNPYIYTLNNPINLTDPTGMIPEKGDRHYFGSDGKTYLGTDGKNDNKAYTLKGGLKPNLNNKSVNWGGRLDAKHAEALRSNSSEGVFDTSKVDSAPTSTIKRTGNGGFDPSRVDGAVINALKYDLPQGLQDTGDAVSLVGYGMTITGIGGGIGIPVAGIGGAMSGVGSAIEIGVEFFSGDYKKAGTGASFMAAEKLINAGLNRVLPGAGKKIGEEGFELGSEILKQGAGLKLNLIQKEIDKD
ncbi:RHS repeat domain-containing protein [Myroides fluvii]|uniref:RHS repeat domain-containing protein n=1 Tax=Myroides fluvii TaxID=2572594 RepID=UPI001E3E478C|nr:RHS repeat-associated core domain-containing protein [Myroides fluvii]